MSDALAQSGFLIWLNQIKYCLANNKYPSNEELYLDLIKQEDLWRKLIISSGKGQYLYAKFIDHVLYEKKNILDARPFFRVRQADFLNKVNPFIKNKQPENLFNLRINFTFITWALNQLETDLLKHDLTVIYQKIMKLRNDFLICNSPLLINRIKLIYSKYSYLYRDIQDLISIASNAALIALDKFVPLVDPVTGEDKYTSVLLSSIIGRINAIAIQDSTNQKIHMYPKDRKILSDLRKMKNSGHSDDAIAEVMGISESEVERLLNSSQMLSLDCATNVSITDEEPEDVYQRNRLIEEVNIQIKNLSVLERKILFLKGLI